jgi:hypothetical protein
MGRLWHKGTEPEMKIKVQKAELKKGVATIVSGVLTGDISHVRYPGKKRS